MASPKQVARQILDSLPDDCSLAEIQYRLYVRQMIEEGRQDVRRGDVFSQEEIEQDLERWLAT
jgi:predicted transcriptional regulator